MSRTTTVPRFIGYVALVARFALIPAYAASLDVTLVDHVITYTDDSGHRQRIDVGKPCDDLWVAPDESAFAFIGVDEYDDDFPGPPSPVVSASTVYIARRSDHFTPKPIANVVRSGPAEFHELHFPSISSDGAYVFFVIIPGNAGFLYAYNLQTGTNEGLDVTGARSLIDYCMVRSGPNAGGVLLHEIWADPPSGFFAKDRCYLRTPGKPEIPVSCPELPKFQPMGAACSQTIP